MIRLYDVGLNLWALCFGISIKSENNLLPRVWIVIDSTELMVTVILHSLCCSLRNDRLPIKNLRNVWLRNVQHVFVKVNVLSWCHFGVMLWMVEDYLLNCSVCCRIWTWRGTVIIQTSQNVSRRQYSCYSSVDYFGLSPCSIFGI
jgi:hypothetical protein